MNELKQAMSSGKTSKNTSNRKEELAPVVTYKQQKRYLATGHILASMYNNHLERGS